MRFPKFAFWPLATTLVLCDCATKRAIEESVTPGMSRPVIKDLVRFTLEYNRGAAFSTHFGRHERALLIAGGFTILGVLIYLYRDLMRSRSSWPAVVGSALAVGGAIGNLIDRVRSPRGVVDFIDVGIGGTRFYIFNIADVGLSVGALLIAYALLRAGRTNSSHRSALADT
jgi:signal peptidase II